MPSSQDNNETISESVAAGVEPAEEQSHTDTEMKQLMAHVRQNFGRINVAPQFSEEDLVPVDVPGFDGTDTDSSGEEEEQEEEKEENEQPENSVDEESQLAVPVAKESPKEVLKALDEKIAKYKKFLDKAKAKRFSAIRYLSWLRGSAILQGGQGLMWLCCSFTPFMTCTHRCPQLAWFSHK